MPKYQGVKDKFYMKFIATVLAAAVLVTSPALSTVENRCEARKSGASAPASFRDSPLRGQSSSRRLALSLLAPGSRFEKAFDLWDIFSENAPARLLFESAGLVIPSEPSSIIRIGKRVQLIPVSVAKDKQNFFEETFFPVKDKDELYIAMIPGQIITMVLKSGHANTGMKDFMQKCRLNSQNINFLRTEPSWFLYLISMVADKETFQAVNNKRLIGEQLYKHFKVPGISAVWPVLFTPHRSFVQIPKEYFLNVLGIKESSLASGPILSLPTVYEPTTVTSQVHNQAVEEVVKLGDDVTIIGSGSGIDTVIAARRGASRITAIDINPIAVMNTRISTRTHGVEGMVDIVEGSIFDHPELLRAKNSLVIWALPVSRENEDDERDTRVTQASRSLTAFDRFCELVASDDIPEGTRFLLSMYEFPPNIIKLMRAGLVLENVIRSSYMQGEINFGYHSFLFTKRSSKRLDNEHFREALELVEELLPDEGLSQHERAKAVAKWKRRTKKEKQAVGEDLELFREDAICLFTVPAGIEGMTDTESLMFRTWFLSMIDIGQYAERYPEIKERHENRNFIDKGLYYSSESVEPEMHTMAGLVAKLETDGADAVRLIFPDYRMLPKRKTERKELFQKILMHISDNFTEFIIEGYFTGNTISEADLEGAHIWRDLVQELKETGFCITRAITFNADVAVEKSAALTNKAFQIIAVKGDGVDREAATVTNRLERSSEASSLLAPGSRFGGAAIAEGQDEYVEDDEVRLERVALYAAFSETLGELLEDIRHEALSALHPSAEAAEWRAVRTQFLFSRFIDGLAAPHISEIGLCLTNQLFDAGEVHLLQTIMTDGRRAFKEKPFDGMFSSPEMEQLVRFVNQQLSRPLEDYNRLVMQLKGGGGQPDTLEFRTLALMLLLYRASFLIRGLALLKDYGRHLHSASSYEEAQVLHNFTLPKEVVRDRLKGVLEDLKEEFPNLYGSINPEWESQHIVDAIGQDPIPFIITGSQLEIQLLADMQEKWAYHHSDWWREQMSGYEGPPLLNEEDILASYRETVRDKQYKSLMQHLLQRILARLNEETAEKMKPSYPPGRTKREILVALKPALAERARKAIPEFFYGEVGQSTLVHIITRAFPVDASLVERTFSKNLFTGSKDIRGSL